MLKARCHCGSVEVEAKVERDHLTQCNCSICRRTGAIYVYGTRRDYRLAKPALSDLDTYSPGSPEDAPGYPRLVFYRCRNCGDHVFHEPSEKKGDDTRIGVNVRMADPETIRGLPMRLLDGANDWDERTVSQWELYL